MGNITFLGVEGSGKTVLTMALVNAFKKYERQGYFLRPETRGAFRFTAQVPDPITPDNLPHQTVSLKQLAWSVVRDGEVIRPMDVLDYPGELYRLAFLDAEDDPDPEGFKARVNAHHDEITAMLQHLFDSDRVFVLFNFDDAIDLDKNAANLDAVWVTNACLDFLGRLPHHPKVTLLLTQVDRYCDLSLYTINIPLYLNRYLPLIKRNFPDLDIELVSVFGPNNNMVGVDEVIRRCMEA